MTLNFLIILSLIQGITEFIPISSSAHLILLPYFTSNNYEGRGFDVCLHFGCLIAVVYYLRHDFKKYFRYFSLKTKKKLSIELIKLIIISSLPVMFFGLIMKIIKVNFEDAIKLIGWTTLLFGIILGLSDLKRVKKNKLNFKDAFLIGLLQALSLIPGVSRSGIVITAGRFLGYSRYFSSKFALMLSIPVLTAAMSLEIFYFYSNETLIFKNEYISGIFLSFIFSLTTIIFFMKYIEKLSLKYFVIYRILLGLIILGVVYI